MKLGALAALSLAAAVAAAPAPPSLFFGFDAGFGNNMVLQRAPAAAAVYGYLDTPSASVRVTVSDAATGAPLYSVDAAINATMQPFGDGWGARPCPKAECPPYDMATFTPFAYALPTWKALLKPTAAGGNYTITAVCTGCGSATPATLTGAAFGDIWVCAGQSNAMLWVSHTFSRNESAAAYAAGNFSNIRIMAGSDVNQPYASWPPAYGGGPKATNPWMLPAEAVPAGCIDKQNCPLFQTSGACWYALQAVAEAGVDVPLGLVALTLGGQRIEEFMYNLSSSVGPYVCDNLNSPQIPWWNGQLFGVYMYMWTDMSIKGWLWYQGAEACAGGGSRLPLRHPAREAPYAPLPPCPPHLQAKTTWAARKGMRPTTQAMRAPCASSSPAGARRGRQRRARRTRWRPLASSRWRRRAPRAGPTLAPCASRRR